mmetsp:Transcript_13580/g.38873  ORF Transcript_13580/g.38873 Transcript_13580/m.38873 type:complete len:129 (+) Transcript_13580:567-953(+)
MDGKHDDKQGRPTVCKPIDSTIALPADENIKSECGDGGATNNFDDNGTGSGEDKHYNQTGVHGDRIWDDRFECQCDIGYLADKHRPPYDRDAILSQNVHGDVHNPKRQKNDDTCTDDCDDDSNDFDDD